MKEFQRITNDKDVPEPDKKYDQDIYKYNYTNLELAINQDTYGPAFARVTKWLKDAEGFLIGVAN